MGAMPHKLYLSDWSIAPELIDGQHRTRALLAACSGVDRSTPCRWAVRRSYVVGVDPVDDYTAELHRMHAMHVEDLARAEAGR